MSKSQKITPFLWFDGKAKEAAEYCCDVFPEVETLSENQFIVQFELFGQVFATTNGGPQFQFSEAASLMIDCKDQQEVNYYWNRFIDDGGTASMCGWLKDKHGFSWQIVPSQLSHFIGNPDQERTGKATQAMLQMKKLNIIEIEQTFNS